MSWMIAVVEDDTDIREHLAEVLKARGFKVVEARHGAEAIEAIRNRGVRPTLMVLDLMMPVMDGWTLLQQQPGERLLADVPVVVVSAYEPPKPLPATVHAVFRKPFPLRALLETVRHLCADLEPPRRVARGTEAVTPVTDDPDDPDKH